MKPKFKTGTPEKSKPILCMCKYEDAIFYVVGYFTGTEFINPETKKPITCVIGWDYIED